MTKPEAINILGSAARFSKTMTTDDFEKLFRLAESLQADYRAAKKAKRTSGRRAVLFWFVKKHRRTFNTY